MVEYTRELLNSNCDFGFVIGLVRRVTRDKLFETRVLERIQANTRTQARHQSNTRHYAR